jgi:DNA-binding CsgD family transcriptional regulator
MCGKKTPPGQYTRAEKEVVKKLLQGKSNKQIADELFVTEKCIKFHITSIYKKAKSTTCREFLAKHIPQINDGLPIEPPLHYIIKTL